VKLCVAQSRPVKGDIAANIERHKALLELARDSDVIVFPELSLTGYEPTLAGELAIDSSDSRLDGFQAISDAEGIAIGVGAPTRSTTAARITMVLFLPHRSRLTYSKRYLHPDEEPFFVSGDNVATVNVNRAVIAPAICYELSIAEHAEKAFRSGASIYMASVAKTAKGLDAALPRLAAIARQYSMTVLMANCVGECDGCQCAGQTSIWNKTESLVGQLSDRDEGILMIDTETQEVVARML
jgi:predicted amidohydrolase